MESLIITTVRSHLTRCHLKSQVSRVCTQPPAQAWTKEYIKASRHWHLWGEFTGDRWIPCTKGQQRGKCFHSMISSWCNNAEASSKAQCSGKLCIYDTYCMIIQSFMITSDFTVRSTVFLSEYVREIKVPTILIPCEVSHWCRADSLHIGSAMQKTHNWQDDNKSSQWLPNTPFASISECLVS